MNIHSQSYLVLTELAKYRVPLTNSHAQTALFVATRADEAADKFAVLHESFKSNQPPFEELIKDIGSSQAGENYMNRARQWRNRFEDVIRANAEVGALVRMVIDAMKLACENQDPR